LLEGRRVRTGGAIYSFSIGLDGSSSAIAQSAGLASPGTPAREINRKELDARSLRKSAG